MRDIPWALVIYTAVVIVALIAWAVIAEWRGSRDEFRELREWTEFRERNGGRR